MAGPPSISDAEWLVMQLLWSVPCPVPAGDVVDALAAQHGWSPLTIKAMLGRLVKERAVRFTKDGKRYLYLAAVAQENCVRAESRSFLQRVFAGAASPMLAGLVEDVPLSDAEIRELTDPLHRKRKKKR